MSCLKCDREVHPDSPEALTKEFACTIKDGQCLRVNCHCNECFQWDGIWCSQCHREVRPGRRSSTYESYVCGVCDPHPSTKM